MNTLAEAGTQMNGVGVPLLLHPSSPSQIWSKFRAWARRCAFGGLLLAVSCLEANGQILAGPQYDQDFSGTAGTLPADWVSAVNGPRVIVGLDGSGRMAIGTGSTDLGAGTTGAAFFTGDFASVSDGVIEDARIETSFQVHSGGNWAGVIARAQSSDTYTPLGYYALINRGQNTLGIWAQAPAATGNADDALVAVTIPTLTSNTDYRLVLTLKGTTLTASLYNLSDEIGVDLPLATASVIDDSYSSGVAGLYARYGGPNRLSSYDSFSIVIPEPSVSLLGGIAAGLILARLRLPRRSSR